MVVIRPITRKFSWRRGYVCVWCRKGAFLRRNTIGSQSAVSRIGTRPVFSGSSTLREFQIRGGTARLSINVVRRRIDDFERQVGATLFTRDVHGTRLTDEGALVVSAVERMEAASFDLMRASSSFTHTLPGERRAPG